jgi:hypothetical protein
VEVQVLSTAPFLEVFKPTKLSVLYDVSVDRGQLMVAFRGEAKLALTPVEVKRLSSPHQTVVLFVSFAAGQYTH